MRKNNSIVDNKISSIINNQYKISYLMKLEKKRRGFSKNDLVFIGIANIAEYYWCAMKSVYKSRQEELKFFSSYLYDRILYSDQLGYIKRVPYRKKALLDIGNEISFDDIQNLPKERMLKIEKSQF